MPKKKDNSSPLTRKQLIEKFFNEYRNKVIEVASFLDRLDRAKNDAQNDFRSSALIKSLKILASNKSNRVKSILMTLSDPDLEPLDSLDVKSAYGAYKPKNRRR